MDDVFEKKKIQVDFFVKRQSINARQIEGPEHIMCHNSVKNHATGFYNISNHSESDFLLVETNKSDLFMYA